MDITEDLSARVLVKHILNVEPPRTPLTRSAATAAGVSGGTRRSSRLHQQNAVTPQHMLRRSLKNKIRESISTKTFPAKRRTASTVLKQTPGPASVLCDDGDTPRVIFKKILLTEPVKSPVVNEQIAAVQPLPSPENSVGSRRPSIEVSDLDLPDLTVGNIETTVKRLNRKRPRRSLNVTAFEKRLKGANDTEEEGEGSLDNTSSLSLSSSTSLSLKTPFNDARTERKALQRKGYHRRKVSEEDFEAAVYKREMGNCLGTSGLVPSHVLGESNYSEGFTLGLSKLSEPDVSMDIVHCNTALYAKMDAAASNQSTLATQEKPTVFASQIQSDMTEQVNANDRPFTFPTEEKTLKNQSVLNPSDGRESLDANFGASSQNEKGNSVADCTFDLKDPNNSGKEHIVKKSELEEADSEAEDDPSPENRGENDDVDAASDQEEPLDQQLEGETDSQTNEEEEEDMEKGEGDKSDEEDGEDYAEEEEQVEVDAAEEIQVEQKDDEIEEEEGTHSQTSEEEEEEEEEENEDGDNEDEDGSQDDDAEEEEQVEADMATVEEEVQEDDETEKEGTDSQTEEEDEEDGMGAVEEVQEGKDDVTEEAENEGTDSQVEEEVEDEEEEEAGMTAEEEVPEGKDEEEASDEDAENDLQEDENEPNLDISEHITRRAHSPKEDLLMPNQNTEVDFPDHPQPGCSDGMPASPNHQDDNDEDDDEAGDNTSKENSFQENNPPDDAGQTEQPVEESEEEEDDEEIPLKTPAFVKQKRNYFALEPQASPFALKQIQSSDAGQSAPGGKPKQKTQRKPRSQKRDPGLPKSYLMNVFKHFAKTKVAADVYPFLKDVMDKFFDRLAKDLEAYALHAGRSTIEIADCELLLRRQGQINDKVPVEVLIEKYLRMDQRKLLIPIATSGNAVFPKRR